MTTLYRFPPTESHLLDATFLKGDAGVFGKLKVESKAGKRLVFLTEHTLICVLKGQKLLHLDGETHIVGPDQLMLLKKGIYVMAEYLENEDTFEALLLFLPSKMLRSLAAEYLFPVETVLKEPFICFKSNALIEDFKAQLRQYFNVAVTEVDALAAMKQKEILLLLMSSGYRPEVGRFIKAAISNSMLELDFVVKTYLFQPLSLSEFANLTNRSLASFKRDFQRAYGCPPKYWINQERLKQAALLLQNTEEPLADIAESCGYESTSYFIRSFKAKYGITPNASRSAFAID